jgi:chemotaxis protein MotA
MDILTWVGLLSGFLIVFFAILSGSQIWDFVNFPSIMIVVFGTLAVTLMKFRWDSLIASFNLAFSTVFLDRVEPAMKVYAEVRKLAEVVRKEGLLGLEKVSIEYPFLQKAVNLGADGHPPEFIQDVLLEDTQQKMERLQVAERVFRGIGDAAPALGMLGTLVGLVQMLNNMGAPSSIGPAMAVALLTTFYGAMIAQLFALPLAEKLQMKALDEQRNRLIVIRSFMSILKGQNPRVLPEILASYLPDPLNLSEDSQHEPKREPTL